METHSEAVFSRCHLKQQLSSHQQKSLDQSIKTTNMALSFNTCLTQSLGYIYPVMRDESEWNEQDVYIYVHTVVNVPDYQTYRGTHEPRQLFSLFTASAQTFTLVRFHACNNSLPACTHSGIPIKQNRLGPSNDFFLKKKKSFRSPNIVVGTV